MGQIQMDRTKWILLAAGVTALVVCIALIIAANSGDDDTPTVALHSAGSVDTVSEEATTAEQTTKEIQEAISAANIPSIDQITKTVEDILIEATAPGGSILTVVTEALAGEKLSVLNIQILKGNNKTESIKASEVEEAESDSVQLREPSFSFKVTVSSSNTNGADSDPQVEIAISGNNDVGCSDEAVRFSEVSDYTCLSSTSEAKAWLSGLGVKDPIFDSTTYLFFPGETKKIKSLEDASKEDTLLFAFQVMAGNSVLTSADYRVKIAQVGSAIPDCPRDKFIQDDGTAICTIHDSKAMATLEDLLDKWEIPNPYYNDVWYGKFRSQVIKEEITQTK
jgi:hypothetical protein